MRFSVVPSKIFSASLFFALILAFATSNSSAQDRKRIARKTPAAKAKKPEKKKTVLPTSNPTVRTQNGLSSKIVVSKNKKRQPLVKKTSSSRATNIAVTRSATMAFSPTRRAMMMQSIRSKVGLRYRYGSQGPRTYDCSGFVWKVFQESGIPFTRTSARYMWKIFTPVYGQDRYEFGTLVFLNRLGHIGIVADENGFYHASSSKGITYSKFAGYWSKRIVGFRRVPFSRYSFGNSFDK